MTADLQENNEFESVKIDVDNSSNNPTPHLIPEGENATPLEVLGCTATDKLLIIMVGVSILHFYCWIKNCLRISHARCTIVLDIR